MISGLNVHFRTFVNWYAVDQFRGKDLFRAKLVWEIHVNDIIVTFEYLNGYVGTRLSLQQNIQTIVGTNRIGAMIFYSHYQRLWGRNNPYAKLQDPCTFSCIQLLWCNQPPRRVPALLPQRRCRWTILLEICSISEINIIHLFTLSDKFSHSTATLPWVRWLNYRCHFGCPQPHLDTVFSWLPEFRPTMWQGVPDLCNF